MKSVVLEIKAGKAAVLNDDGTIQLIPDRNYKPGDVITGEIAAPSDSTRTGTALRKVYTFAMRYQAIAASLLITVGLALIGAGAYAFPCTSVDIDINPSVEYKLNIFDRVLCSHAFNDDGAAITEGMELKGKKIDTAMKMTLDSLRDSGYIGESTTVVYAVDSRFSKGSSISKNMADTVSQWNDEQEEAVSVSAVSVEVTKEVRKEAKEKNVSAGKLTLVKELQNSTGDTVIDEDEWLKKPVAEIMKATADPASATTTAVAAETSASEEETVVEPVKNTNKKNNKDKKKKEKEKAKVEGETLAAAETESAAAETETAVATASSENTEGKGEAGEGNDPGNTEETAPPAATTEKPVQNPELPTEQPTEPQPADPGVQPADPGLTPEQPTMPETPPVQPELPPEQPATPPQTPPAPQTIQPGASDTSTSDTKGTEAGSTSTSDVSQSSTENLSESQSQD